MSILSRFFPSKLAALLCPHCEKEMAEGHNVDACAKKRMSRRFFFGVMGGAVAVAAVAPHVKLPGTGSYFNPVADVFGQYHGNQILTTKQVTFEMLEILNNKLVAGKKTTRNWERTFAKSGAKIGDTIHIRRPDKYTITGASWLA